MSTAGDAAASGSRTARMLQAECSSCSVASAGVCSGSRETIRDSQMERRQTVSEKRQELVKVLNQALAAEYGTLWLLPRHMAQVKDEELKRQLRLIAEAELEHAEKSAQMIYGLGEKPTEDLPNLRVRSGVQEILEAHLQGEQEAIALYERAYQFAEDTEMRKRLQEMRKDEEGHQRLLQMALDKVLASPG